MMREKWQLRVFHNEFHLLGPLWSLIDQIQVVLNAISDIVERHTPVPVYFHHRHFPGYICLDGIRSWVFLHQLVALVVNLLIAVEFYSHILLQVCYTHIPPYSQYLHRALHGLPVLLSYCGPKINMAKLITKGPSVFPKLVNVLLYNQSMLIFIFVPKC